MDFEFKAGSIPILVSMPHVGADIPDDIAARLSPCALAKADTDWHLAELYGFLGEMGASTIAARWSRYVIDVNRPPEDTNLYPGLDTTGLCPVDTFGREQFLARGA
jgi:N-formylglutamate deformylase